MTTLWQDLRYCVRSFGKTPGFSLVVILTLALGIGANTAIFSVLNAAILRPLPYPEPDRLAMVFTQFPTIQQDQFPMSAPEFLEYRMMTQSFDAISAFYADNVSIAGAESPQRVRVLSATADLWRVLAVEPHLGRVFGPDEDVPGPASDVAVLSHELWSDTFNADASIIGRTIRVNSVPVTVLGVMPPGFDLLENDVEIWMPMALDPANPGNRGGHNYRVVGRLADRVSVDQANGELASLYTQWDNLAANQHHPGIDEDRNHPMILHPLTVIAFGDTRPAMFLLLGIVGFILLIACANVANLLLARAEVRRRELAVRLALGAPKWRMIRQLFTESITLALVGGVVGLLLAWWILKLMLVFIPDSVPRADEISIDPMVLIFTMVVSVGTGIIFGLAPILRISMPRLHAALKAAGSRGTDGVAHHRFRHGLVIGEIALALVLITGAGLMIRSFSRLQHVDPGFDPTGVLTMSLFLPGVDYPENAQITAFYTDLVRRVKALPGVQTAAVAWGLPPRRSANYNSHRIESYQGLEDANTPNLDFLQIASNDYFEALGIPLMIGRLFDANDTPDSEPVMVINQALATKFWPTDGQVPESVSTDGSRLIETNPLEDRISDWSDPPNWFRIVGIVGDAKQGGMEHEVGTEYFVSFEQIGKFGFVPNEMNLIVRSESGDPLVQLAPVTEIIRSMDAALPISNVQTMHQSVYESIATQRFAAVLLGAFGILAACLATVGIYSVMAFSVAQRTNEFGIRMALGAQTGDVLRHVLRQGTTLTVIGIVLGLGFALALGKFLALRLDEFLFELSPDDPLTLAAVAILLVVTAITACIIPARRATRVDPMVALRYE